MRISGHIDIGRLDIHRLCRFTAAVRWRMAARPGGSRLGGPLGGLCEAGGAGPKGGGWGWGGLWRETLFLKIRTKNFAELVRKIHANTVRDDVATHERTSARSMSPLARVLRLLSHKNEATSKDGSKSQKKEM